MISKIKESSNENKVLSTKINELEVKYCFYIILHAFTSDLSAQKNKLSILIDEINCFKN